MNYYVYILRCADHTYYVGHTDDVWTRVNAHNAGRGARHMKLRRPVELKYFESVGSLKAAINREHQIKRWTRAKKESLISSNADRLHDLSKRRH